MPTNQYGYNDNFNLETGHVLPAALRKFHLGKLLYLNDFNSIRYDLSRYCLGWDINPGRLADNKTIELKLNKAGIYKDKVILWGNGNVYREFMSSKDLAEACIYILEYKDYKDCGEVINITGGKDIQLNSLFDIIKNIVGYSGEIVYDNTQPEGTYRKLMDKTKIKELGWSPKISLEEGVKDLYNWYLRNEENGR